VVSHQDTWLNSIDSDIDIDNDRGAAGRLPRNDRRIRVMWLNNDSVF